ncbi:MAG: nucleotidyltransferase family protein [Gammaproteobacteria bacterium]
MKRVCALLLAAGESRRMGAANKLTLDVNGEPLVRRTARTLLASGIAEVVAVLGHEAETIAPLLADLPVKQVTNAGYAHGQMTSVHRGMAALDTPADGVMVALADQALLTVADVNALIDAFQDIEEGRVLVPVHQGRRGNPIILSFRHREAILAGAPNLGCRRLLERHPELVTPVEMASDHVVFDLDTPEDYARLQRRLDAVPAAGRTMEG